MILAAAATMAGFVSWMLAIQKSIHDDYRLIQSQVNEVLRADSVAKEKIWGVLDEHQRWMCTYHAHASHLGCD